MCSNLFGGIEYSVNFTQSSLDFILEMLLELQTHACFHTRDVLGTSKFKCVHAVHTWRVLKPFAVSVTFHIILIKIWEVRSSIRTVISQTHHSIIQSHCFSNLPIFSLHLESASLYWKCSKPTRVRQCQTCNIHIWLCSLQALHFEQINKVQKERRQRTMNLTMDTHAYLSTMHLQTS